MLISIWPEQGETNKRASFCWVNLIIYIRNLTFGESNCSSIAAIQQELDECTNIGTHTHTRDIQISAYIQGSHVLAYAMVWYGVNHTQTHTHIAVAA